MDEENVRRTLGENIAACRKAAGLTQGALGEKLGYSDKSVSKWERGDGVPDVYVLVKLSSLFGCTTDSLLGIREAPIPDGALSPRRRTKRKMIPALSVLLVWLTAAVAYFVLGLLPFSIPKTWLAFVYAAPASCIVLTVFFRLWYSRVFQCAAVSGIIWGVAVSLWLTFRSMANMHSLFLIAAILQVLAILWFIMRSRMKRGAEAEAKPAAETE